VAGEQKRKERAVLVTKALLLGYTIEPYDTGEYTLRLPTGHYHTEWRHIKGQSCRFYYACFPAKWLAAKKALELAGVLHAKKS
jgi:uncharacterized iron-regulated membrane protein